MRYRARCRRHRYTTDPFSVRVKKKNYTHTHTHIRVKTNRINRCPCAYAVSHMYKMAQCIIISGILLNNTRRLRVGFFSARWRKPYDVDHRIRNIYYGTEIIIRNEPRLAVGKFRFHIDVLNIVIVYDNFVSLQQQQHAKRSCTLVVLRPDSVAYGFRMTINCLWSNHTYACTGHFNEFLIRCYWSAAF